MIMILIFLGVLMNYCLQRPYHFQVSSLLFVPSHVVALSTLGVHTALVVDMGAVETVVIPVHEGVAVLHAWQAQPLAANAVERSGRF